VPIPEAGSCDARAFHRPLVIFSVSVVSKKYRRRNLRRIEREVPGVAVGFGLWFSATLVRAEITKRNGWIRNGMRMSGLDYPREFAMPKRNSTPETGEQVPARRHDSGSQANETVDGLDAATEALRHAAEDTPSGTAPEDVEKTPVFDRAGQAPRI
jgi:hypothetical protein